VLTADATRKIRQRIRPRRYSEYVVVWEKTGHVWFG
jgi:hypothetical protein